MRHGWEGAPLPRGRHNLSAQAVRSSQRDRLLRAMIGLVGEHGYADTSVPMVVSAARVSRSSFYALFADKTDCFIAACDEESSGMLKLMLEAGAEEDWVRAARRGMERYLKWWQRHPAFSRAYFVELPAAGSRAVRQRDRQYARYRKLFAALGERAREEQPELPPLSPLATRLIVAGITEVVAEEVRAGRIGGLDALADDLLYLVLRLLADDATAERAVSKRRLRLASAH